MMRTSPRLVIDRMQLAAIAGFPRDAASIFGWASDQRASQVQPQPCLSLRKKARRYLRVFGLVHFCEVRDVA